MIFRNSPNFVDNLLITSTQRESLPLIPGAVLFQSKPHDFTLACAETAPQPRQGKRRQLHDERRGNHLAQSSAALVITIDLVSTDARSSASGGALGLAKET